MTSDQTPPAPAEIDLPKVQLGRTGKSVSRMGLGGFHQLEIDAEAVSNVIDTFLACGGNYIETARAYGSGASENKIGRALESRRDKVILASKTGAATADEARRDLEESFKQLRTDHLDFYFLHGVDAQKLETVTAPGGAVEGLMAARSEGLIDGIGLSSHTPATYLEAMDRIDLSLILVWCNYLDNQNYPIIPEQILPEAMRRGVGVTGMKPLADGLLHESVADAMAYCLGMGAEVAVCGANSPVQVRQSAAAVAAGPADAEQIQRILNEAPELGHYVCRRCGQCPDSLMDLFGWEGMIDRQMIDLQSRDPANHALRARLSNWFHNDQAARDAFAAAGYDPAELQAAAMEITCPYHINVHRKTRIALAKLMGQPINRL
ncbi:MAG: aldo/keto reductase [Phycisphaerae bacterium]